MADFYPVAFEDVKACYSSNDCGSFKVSMPLRHCVFAFWFAATGDLLSSQEDRTMLMTCLIHCADISNPLLPERRNVQWASLVIQEFNAQVSCYHGACSIFRK